MNFNINFIIFNFVYLIQFVTGSYIINKNCINYDNKDKCINNFGCGWCNETSVITNLVEETCSEIQICPLQIPNNSSCLILEEYYHDYYCFLNTFIIYTLFILGFCLILLFCYIGFVLSYFGKNKINNFTWTQYSLMIFLYFMFTLIGIGIFIYNDFVFSNMTFVLLLLFIIILIFSLYLRVSRKKPEYTILQQEPTYSINKF